MAKKETVLASLDLGSNKVICAIAKIKDNVINITGIGEVPTVGLQNGIVISIEDTVSAIQKSVQIAEDISKEIVTSVYVSIKGPHIETCNHNGAINIARTNKEITEEDRELVLDAARQLQITNNKEIIQTISQGFIVDEQQNVPNPVGMDGSHLGVNVHLVTGSTTVLNNIYKSINKAGLKIIGIMYGSIVTGDTAITKEEKDLGVALIDIGGEVIDIITYARGNIYYTTELNIGGDYITKDIAYGLRSSVSNAQDLKKTYGAAHSDFVGENIDIEYTSVDGITKKQTSPLEISNIIYPRLEEIFNMIKSKLIPNNQGNAWPAGIVITGGTASMPGIQEIGEKILELPVRKGIIHDISGNKNITLNPSYTTNIGLIKYVNKSIFNEYRIGTRKKTVINKIRTILEDIF